MRILDAARAKVPLGKDAIRLQQEVIKAEYQKLRAMQAKREREKGEEQLIIAKIRIRVQSVWERVETRKIVSMRKALGERFNRVEQVASQPTHAASPPEKSA